LLLEVGAGAGRNTPRYVGFEHVVLLDYSLTQLQQARQRLGASRSYTYVAADVYQLPFVEALFGAATMIRTLHHMAEPQRALQEVRKTLQRGAIFVLEFANKKNMKAILRYWAGKQQWSPFTLEAAEFAPLNFDFHPRAVREWLTDLGFIIERTLAVSHFRIGWLKRLMPARILAGLDGLLQPTGGLIQLTPSVFIKASLERDSKRARDTEDTVAPPTDPVEIFKCPKCGHRPLERRDNALSCASCESTWAIRDGVYDFRSPV